MRELLRRRLGHFSGWAMGPTSHPHRISILIHSSTQKVRVVRLWLSVYVYKHVIMRYRTRIYSTRSIFLHSRILGRVSGI